MSSAVFKFEGPLYDPKVYRRLEDAIAKGLETVAATGVEIMEAVIWTGGVVDSKAMVSSVEREGKRTKGIGYQKVLPTDMWKEGHPGRPTKTWIEKGVREGRKTKRKGYGVSGRTATRVRHEMKQADILDPILRVLNEGKKP